MSKNPIDPLGDEGFDPEAALKEVMNAGPSIEKPPVTKAQPTPAPVQEEEVPQGEEAEAEKPTSFKELMMQKLKLPTEQEIAQLKAQHKVRSLTVVPLVTDDDWETVQYFIVKPLNRARWRAAMDVVKQRVEQGAIKEGADPEEVFAARVVTEAIVYPQIIEGQLDALPAGLVPTVYSIVQKLSWFFDPDKLANLTITL